MCGRYTQTLSADDLAIAMSAEDVTDGGVEPNYNVAPTATMPMVVGEPSRDDVEEDEVDERALFRAAATGGLERLNTRVLRLARWGLVPSWAKDAAIGSKMINARAETAVSKPAFRAAMARRRCLVPATGYYEWHRPDGGSRRGQPYFIHPGIGGIVAFAGLFEVWRRDGEPLTTFTILTTGSAAGLEFLHDRSPVVLSSGDWSRWLDPALTDPTTLADLLAPAAAGVLSAYPVDPAVGNVRNNSPKLLEPVEFDAHGGVLAPRSVDLTLFDM